MFCALNKVEDFFFLSFTIYYVFCGFICLAASTGLSITTVIVIVATFLVWTTDFVRLVLVKVSAMSNLTL